MRYDSSGNLDSTFGSGGKVNTDVVTTAFTSQDRINSVKIQGDGRIVVTGFSLSRAGQFSADEHDFVVARYLASGSLDTTYDPVPPAALPSVPGTRRIDYGFRTDIGEAVALQVDGKYVIAGSTNALNAHNDNDSFSLRTQTRSAPWIRHLVRAGRLPRGSAIMYQARSATHS